MSDTLVQNVSARSRHFRWRLAFMVGMFGTAGLMLWADLPKLAPWLLILPALFALPMWHEAQQDRKQQGEPSKALAEHDLRILVAVFAFIACMAGATAIGKAIGPGSPWLWAVAVIPMLPIVGLAWAEWRYLAEEADEFLRHRTINAALIGIVAVLLLATLWGTLELFLLVPHAQGWWLLPAFAVARDAAKFCLKATGR